MKKCKIEKDYHGCNDKFKKGKKNSENITVLKNN